MFPLVAVPVIDQIGQSLFFVVPDMETASCVVSRYGRCRVAIAQRFRCRYLPRCECRLILHCLVLSNNAGAFLLPHHPRAEPRSLRSIAMDMDQNIFQVGLLAADSVNPHATHGVAHQPQPRSRFHRLLLRVACEDDLRTIAF